MVLVLCTKSSVIFFFKRMLSIILVKIEMTTFRKAKQAKADYQMNIDKYRVAANITEYHIVSKE